MLGITTVGVGLSKANVDRTNDYPVLYLGGVGLSKATVHCTNDYPMTRSYVGDYYGRGWA